MSRAKPLPLLLAAVLTASLLAVALAPAAPIPAPKKPSVEVVFCIDTTGSMGGLLDGAKLKIWGICNQILNGRPMPNLKVGLVPFRDKNEEYVTKVFDLREDLDDVYADLQTFSAAGGGDEPEHVNQALDDSVNKIKWSDDKNTLRILFLIGDAAPHMDYTDDVKYPLTCAIARDRGILINTIQCGSAAECTRAWKDICEKGGGSYVAIPQAGGVRNIATPQDKRLSAINKELAATTVVFGDERKREADMKKVQTAQSLPQEIAADRAGYMAKEGRVARYDLLDTIRAGKTQLETLRAEELPPALQKMTPKERRAHLDKVADQRAKLLREANALDRERGAYIAKEVEKNQDSFDAQALSMLRKQAARRIRY